MLRQVPDHQFADYIVKGIERGFCVCFDYAKYNTCSIITNMLSAEICYQLIGIPTSGAVFGTAG